MDPDPNPNFPDRIRIFDRSGSGFRTQEKKVWSGSGQKDPDAKHRFFALIVQNIQQWNVPLKWWELVDSSFWMIKGIKGTGIVLKFSNMGLDPELLKSRSWIRIMQQ